MALPYACLRTTHRYRSAISPPELSFRMATCDLVDIHLRSSILRKTHPSLHTRYHNASPKVGRLTQRVLTTAKKEKISCQALSRCATPDVYTSVLVQIFSFPQRCKRTPTTAVGHPFPDSQPRESELSPLEGRCCLLYHRRVQIIGCSYMMASPLVVKKRERKKNAREDPPSE